MIVFSEADFERDDADADLAGLTRAALKLGLRVVRVFPEAAAEEPLTGALERQAQNTPALRFGTILSADHYARFHAQARALGVSLLNTPEQHLAALEFDRSAEKLEPLTPKTRTVTSVSEVAGAVEALGLPVFVKGSVASRKWFGWKACVADSLPEAEALTAKLLGLSFHSRQKVMLRQVAALRRSGVEYEKFPFAREYRLFALHGEVLARGYYWPFGDAFGAPTPADLDAMDALVRETARRLEVPWLSVDVGQCENGEWIVIETGDPQCSGLGNIAPGPLVEALAQRLRS